MGTRPKNQVYAPLNPTNREPVGVYQAVGGKSGGRGTEHKDNSTGGGKPDSSSGVYQLLVRGDNPSTYEVRCQMSASGCGVEPSPLSPLTLSLPPPPPPPPPHTHTHTDGELSLGQGRLGQGRRDSQRRVSQAKPAYLPYWGQCNLHGSAPRHSPGVQ